jgi:hypothetical protein
MPFDKFVDMETLSEERRRAVQESLQTVSIDELKKIAKEHEEEFVGDPWRDEFLRLIVEQPQASFYRAVPQPGAEVYYCRDADLGVWILPGSGMGPLDATGKRLMKEAIANGLSGRKSGDKR